MIEEWEGFLAENPKVLWSLVADVVKAVKAGEGERKTGRRPAASCSSIEELYDLLFPPSYATEPFPTTLGELMKRQGVSQGALAKACHVNQSTISRVMSGSSIDPRWRQPLTTDLMEAIAVALNVRPTYFAEYRAMKLGEIVSDTLLSNPTLSAESVRRFFLAGAPA